MKEKITYIKRCVRCNEETTYILRDYNTNIMSDKDALITIDNVSKNEPIFEICEKCNLVTKQEIIAFDY